MPKETLKTIIARTLEKNQIESRGYRYTRPAPSVYEQQWLWDSCFHAIIYCHLDPEMAKNELRSLLNHRGEPDDGMIPHMIYWNGSAQEVWGEKYVSTITQPPLIAYAALRIYQRTKDRSFLLEIYEAMRRYYDWLLHARDPDQDGLVSLIHPWESGWDASPRWDDALNLQNPTDDEARQARIALAEALKQKRPFDLSNWPKDMFFVEPADYNAIFSANLTAMARIAVIIDFKSDAHYFSRIVEKVNQAMNEKMWDEKAGFYWDLAGFDEIPIRIPTAASFIPLFAGIASPQQAEHLISNLATAFNTPTPIPTVASNHPAFASDRYWRGSTWLNVNWFVVKGLQNYGMHAMADRISAKSIELVEKQGLYEYYDSVSGRGLGAEKHSWSGIVIDMENGSGLYLT